MGGALDIQSGAVVALTLGFLLGLKHATDADHVVAVSTIVGEYRNAWRGLWVGASWGLGHTTPLLVLGIVVLMLKEATLSRYETVAPLLEFGVGIMLVLLGGQVFWKLYRGQLHSHVHRDDAEAHLHIHTHAAAEETQVEEQRHHGFFTPGRPFFRTKSFVIGIVHGLAGSAAVMLVLLPQISSFWTGVGYLVLFGVGTILSMGLITVGLGIPFAMSTQFTRLNRAVAGVAGSASLLLGVVIMLETTTDATILPF